MSIIAKERQEVGADNLHELSFEDAVTLHRAVGFALDSYKDRAVIDPLDRLPHIRQALADLIFPLCDEEEIPVEYDKAQRGWREACQDAGGVAAAALTYLAVQDPAWTAERDKGVYAYLVPFISSAQHMIAHPQSKQDMLL